MGHRGSDSHVWSDIHMWIHSLLLCRENNTRSYSVVHAVDLQLQELHCSQSIGQRTLGKVSETTSSLSPFQLVVLV